VNLEFERWGYTLLKRSKTNKKKEVSAMVGKGSSNSTAKLKYILLLSAFIVSQINYTTNEHL